MLGSVLMLIGFISIYQQSGSFELSAIKDASKNNPVSNLAVALILAGILSKSATLPFHTWLPDVGVAPSSVTALALSFIRSAGEKSLQESGIADPNYGLCSAWRSTSNRSGNSLCVSAVAFNLDIRRFGEFWVDNGDSSDKCCRHGHQRTSTD
jgi:hypothetical protein